MKSSKQIKQLRKEVKRLRRLAGKLAVEKDHWKEMYEDLDGYVSQTYKDY